MLTNTSVPDLPDNLSPYLAGSESDRPQAEWSRRSGDGTPGIGIDVHGDRIYIPGSGASEPQAVSLSEAGYPGSEVIGGAAPTDSRTALEQFFAVCPDILVITDMEGTILQWNPAWQTLLGYTAADLERRSSIDFVHPEDLAETQMALLELQNEKPLTRFINRYRNSSGAYIYLEWNSRTCDNLVFSSARNVTREYVQEKHIEYLSFHDQQTGLYNRRFLTEEMRRLDTARSLPVSVILGDLNRLRLVNEAFGFEKGNELIRKAAQALRRGCRAEDLLGRWGDDEFLLFLPNTDTAQAQLIVDRMQGFCCDGQVNGIRLCVSFGIATRGSLEEDLRETLRRAETAMYDQKAIDKKNSRGESIKALTSALYERNPDEEGHANYVSSLCRMMALMLGLNPKEVNKLALSGLMHDIGKIAVSTDVLEKPESLSDEEWAQVRQHPEKGYRVVSSVQDMVEVGNAILAHHEYWDGSGYPRGLKMDEIPLFARVIALAESYASMTRENGYKSSLTRDEAIAELRRHAGTQFDPALVEVFIQRVILDQQGVA